MKVTEPTSKEDFEKYYSLRWEILRKPWKQPPGSERDEMDFISVHAFVKNENDNVVAVGRLHFNSPAEGQIRYMAVHPDYKGKHLGGEILKYLEYKAKEKSLAKIILQAREGAINFYKKHGFEVIEKTFLLYDSVQHYKMQKLLK